MQILQTIVILQPGLNEQVIKREINKATKLLQQYSKVKQVKVKDIGEKKLAYDIKSNMVRVGISLYGLYPDLPPEVNYKPKLKQVMGLKGRITNIHEVKAGEGVSYSHKFIAYEPTRVATIPIGYADGVSRNLSNKIYGLINGQKVRQIGNITMDQMMFDLGEADAQVGDVITLLDDSNLSLDSWAEILHTINYELTCRLKVRLPRIYVR